MISQSARFKQRSAWMELKHDARFYPHRITAIHVRGFKGIHDSEWVRLERLTVIIGRNGAGKSSLLEAIEFVGRLLLSGVAKAGQPWLGTQNLIRKRSFHWESGSNRMVQSLHRPAACPALEISLRLAPRIGKGASVTYSVTVAYDPKFDACAVVRERIEVGRKTQFLREGNELVLDSFRPATLSAEQPDFLRPNSDQSKFPVLHYSGVWHTLARGVIPLMRMAPSAFLPRLTSGDDAPEAGRDSNELSAVHKRLYRVVKDSDHGEQTAQLEAQLHEWLPFVTGLPPRSTGLESDVHTEYIALQEAALRLPGWLASHGTQRLIAMLVRLYAAEMPAVLLLEDFEDGLDPFTLERVASWLLSLWPERGCQVILTTHSPHLLKFFPLSALLLVSRQQEKGSTFRKPAQSKDLVRMSGYTSPGSLFVAGDIERLMGQPELAQRVARRNARGTTVRRKGER
jgi:predicted ATPase